MNKAALWSVKGVDFDAREAAREAARRAGMSLGEWLNDVIADQAREMGVSFDEVDEEGRLEAVTARLASLSGRGRRQFRRHDRDTGDDPAPPRRRPSNTRPRIDIHETAYGMDPRERSRAGGAVNNPEALLDAAIRAYERGADRGDKASDAMARMADRLEQIGKRLDRAPEEPESRRDRRPALSGPDDDKIARLEARLEALAREKETERSERSLRALELRLEDMASRIGGARPEAKSPDEVSRIESKLNKLIEKIENRDDAAPSDRAAPRSRGARPAPPQVESSRRLDEAVARITRRQRMLDELPAERPSSAPTGVVEKEPFELRREIDRISRKLDETQRLIANRESAPASPPPPDPAVAALSQEVAGLNRRLSDALRALADRREGAASMRQDPAFEAVQRDISDLSRRVEEANSSMLARFDKRATEAVRPIEGALRDLGKRFDQSIRDNSREALDAVRPIEGALRDLGQRFDQSARENSRDALLQPIAEMTAEVRRAVEELAPSRGIDKVERAIRDLGARIENSREGMIDSAAVAAIQAQTNDIRELLRRATARAPAMESIERQIARLTERLEGGGAINVGAPAGTEAAGQGGNPAMIELLASRIDQLSQKLDEALNQSGSVDQIDDLARRIDNVHQSLTNRLDQLPERAGNSQTLERMLGDIAARLERPAMTQAVDTTDTAHIESMLREIGARFDQSSSNLDRTALDQLRRDVSRLTQVVESLGKSSVDLDFIEEMRQDLARLADHAAQAAPAAAPSSDFHEMIEALAARLDKVDEGARALGSLEASIADLAHRIEDSRRVALDAAQTAARDAAQLTVDEVMARLPARDSGDSAHASDIADLRAMQEAIDRRTYSTLSAVHETLEKVVDRIAVIEDEVAGAKPVAIAARAPTPAPAIDKAPPEESDGLLAMGAMPVFAPAGDVASPKLAGVTPSPANAHPADEDEGAEDPDFDPAHEPVAARSRSGEPAAAPAIQPETKPASVVSERKSWLEGVRQQARANVAGAPRGDKPSRTGDAKGKPVAEEASADPRARAMAAHKAWATGQAGAAEPGSRGMASRARGLFGSPRRPVIMAGVASLLLFSAFMFSKHFSRQETPPDRSDLTAAAPAPVAAPPAAPLAPPAPAAPATPEPAPAAAPAQTAPDSQTGAAPKRRGAALDTPNQAVADAQTGQPVDRSPVSSINTGAAGGAATSRAGGLQAAAEQGDATAEYELGSRYADGRSVAKDPARAVEWLTKAAGHRLAPAAYRLGSIYERGLAGERNLAKARDWYSTAANAGNIRAMHNLAVLSAEGVDGKPDYPTAANWFKRAAEYGVRDSQYNLAILYARGLGVEQNLGRSWAWFAIAAAQGDSDAAKKQEDVGSRLDSQQLADAKAFVAGYRAKTPDKSANEVPTPAGGWDAPSARMESKPGMFPSAPAISVSPPPLFKAPPKGKVSSL